MVQVEERKPAVMPALGELTRQALALHDKLDEPIINITRKVERPALDKIMKALSGTAEPWALWPVSGAVGLWWLAHKRRADAAALALALAGSGAINKTLKALVRRPRPQFKPYLTKPSGSSFPSNHMAMSVATYGAMAYLIAHHRGRIGRRTAALVSSSLLLLFALQGWSRVYHGVHHPSDVLGGWAAGAAWLALCRAVYKQIASKQRRAAWA